MQELIGVKFLPAVSQRKPWRAQINRCNRGYYLGLFRTSQEACRAYDNASYYLRPWAANRSAMLLNFPADWEKEIPAPNRKTIEVRGILKAKYPAKEIAAQGKKGVKTSEELEHSMMALLDNIDSSTGVLRKRLVDAIGRNKLMEARINDLEADIEKRDRIIEGLHLQGGQQFFKKVEGKTVPATAVESHLDSSPEPIQVKLGQTVDEMLEEAEANSEADFPNE